MSSTNSSVGKRPMSFWIHMLVCSVIMIGFGFLPPLAETITPFGMRVLGIFIGLFYGWIFIEFTWPSLLALVILGLTDYTTIGGAFMEGFGDSSTINIILLFVFAAYLQKAGTLTWVTQWIISRKMLVGRPWLFTMAFICATIPISVFVNAFAGIILLFAMFGSFCKDVGLEKKDMYVTYVCAGVANLGAMLSVAFPFMPFSIVIFNLSGPANGVTEIPFGPWMIWGIVAIIIFSVMYYILGRYILRIDVSKLDGMGDQFSKYRGAKMNSEQKFGAFLIVLFVAFLVLPTYTSGAVKAFLGNFGVQGAVIFCLVLAFLYQFWQGGNLYSFTDMVRDGVNWDLVIIFMISFPVCNALESAEAGVISTIVTAIMPFVNSVSPLVFLLLVSVFFCLVTQISHNLVLIIALVPSLAKIAMGVGLNPVVFGLFFSLCCQIAVASPAASAASAMVFGHSEWVEPKYAYKVGVGTLIVWLLGAVCVMLPATIFIF